MTAKVSVVVPSYRRVNDLVRCLDTMNRQTYTPLEVIVVYRNEDSETSEFLKEWLIESSPYLRKTLVVHKPGQVYALMKGVTSAMGEIVAFTDDDGAPANDWIERLVSYYADPLVGGVGGRDKIVSQQNAPRRKVVGKLQWYGKLVGNHHVGMGPPRSVDVLKGVNMSFRKSVVKFPSYLLGYGAQTHNEVGLCLRIRKMGYRLIYDPDIVVHHFPAQRFDIDQRDQFKAAAVRFAAFNLQVSVLKWTPWPMKIFRVIYALSVGDKASPGLARLGIGLLRGEHNVMRAFVPSQTGQMLAILYMFNMRIIVNDRPEGIQ